LGQQDSCEDPAPEPHRDRNGKVKVTRSNRFGCKESCEHPDEWNTVHKDGTNLNTPVFAEK